MIARPAQNIYEAVASLFMFSFLMFLVALAQSCVREKPASPPPPPSIAESHEGVAPTRYPKQAPARPRDMIVKNCTVTNETGNKAQCICRNASTQIDVHDPSKQMLVCK